MNFLIKIYISYLNKNSLLNFKFKKIFKITFKNIIMYYIVRIFKLKKLFYYFMFYKQNKTQYIYYY